MYTEKSIYKSANYSALGLKVCLLKKASGHGIISTTRRFNFESVI